MISKFLKALPLLTLAACVNMWQPYKEPQSGETANITILNQSNNQIIVHHFSDGERCARASISALNDGRAQPPKSALTYKVSANKKMALRISMYESTGYKEGRYCNIIASTTPAPDSKHVLAFNMENQQCGISSTRVDESGKILEKNTFKFREQTGDALLQGGWCHKE